MRLKRASLLGVRVCYMELKGHAMIEMTTEVMNKLTLSATVGGHREVMIISKYFSLSFLRSRQCYNNLQACR